MKRKINYKLRNEFDFGLFSDDVADGHVHVNEKKWLDYINLRSEFEKAHQKLLDKIDVYKRKKLLGKQ